MRDIQKRDFQFILNSLLRLREESPEYNYVEPSDFNIEAVYQYFCGGLDHEVLFGVIEPEVGFMFGGAQRAWYNPRYIQAFEQLLYVVPERRDGRVGIRLVNAFEEKCRLLGVNKVFAGATTGIKDEKVLKMYERLGWTRSPTGMEKTICAYRDSIH